MQAKWGLAAVGKSGEIEIDVDEPLSERVGWQIVVRAPNIYLAIEIDGADVVRQILKFFDATIGKKLIVRPEMHVGRCLGSDAFLLKDDEFDDRYYLRLKSRKAGHVLVETVGEWTGHLHEALKQTVHDLDG